MKKTLSISLTLCVCIFLCGCMAAQVPKTTLTGSLGGAPFEFSSPKDVDMTNFVARAETNGAMSITIGAIHAKMNPDVITTTGTAQALMITAVADGVAKGMGTAAGTAAAAAIK